MSESVFDQARFCCPKGHVATTAFIYSIGVPEGYRETGPLCGICIIEFMQATFPAARATTEDFEPPIGPV